MLSRSGELERTDFDTFDPRYYPFLAAPITADMQPGACISRSALNFPALARGDQVTTWIWSDSGLIGVILQPEGNERLTVAAGSFDAIRVRIDVDLSKVFPSVPALFLSLVKPHFAIWITRAKPYYLLKMVGFGAQAENKLHKNTAIELASIADLNPNDSGGPAELAQAEALGPQPPLTTVNSGRWAQGTRTGHVTLST